MAVSINIIEELQWRTLTHQCTDLEAVTKELESSTVVYAGFDPTSDSLHVGSLLPLMMLRRFQQAGHKPIALVGGATGMVGDPSGKTDERILLSKEALQHNVAGLENQMHAREKSERAAELQQAMCAHREERDREGRRREAADRRRVPSAMPREVTSLRRVSACSCRPRSSAARAPPCCHRDR